MDDREVVSVPPISEDDHESPTHVPRGLIGKIIRARVEETLEMIRDRIRGSGFSPIVGKRVVLTGGASQLTGLPELARQMDLVTARGMGDLFHAKRKASIFVHVVTRAAKP